MRGIMANDWAKLIADAKKLEVKFKNLTLDDGNTLWKELQSRDKSMETHETSLQKATLAAYEAGVGSKKVAEFLNDKGFAAAYRLLDTDRKLLGDELKLLEAHCDKCKSAADLVEAQIAVMDKALVSSKGTDKSAERTAAKKVRDGLYLRFNDMNAASNLRYKPDKYMTGFDKTFDKIVDHLIAEAFKKGKDPANVAEIPQPLSDKKLPAAVKVAQGLHKVVMTCAEKMLAPKTPAPQIELLSAKAWAAQNDLRDTVTDFEGLVKKFKKELAAADPKGEVEDKVKAMAKLYDEAHVALIKADNKAGKVT